MLGRGQWMVRGDKGTGVTSAHHVLPPSPILRTQTWVIWTCAFGHLGMIQPSGDALPHIDDLPLACMILV